MKITILLTFLFIMMSNNQPNRSDVKNNLYEEMYLHIDGVVVDKKLNDKIK